MKKLKGLLFVFECVTTCVVFVTAVYITIFWPEVSLEVDILWEILLISFFTSLGACLYSKEEASKKAIIIGHLVYYVYCNIVVLGCGIWFEWFYADNLAMVFGMVLAIAVVFLLVSIASVAEWKREKKLAALMNERLKGYQQEKPSDSEHRKK